MKATVDSIERMEKTVSQLTPEELKQYDPARNLDKILDASRWEKAQAKLPELLSLLRGQFEAKRIKVFGSLADKERYTRWSDIDLAVWGIPSNRFYDALDAVNELSQDIKVDLIDPQTCKSLVLKAAIEKEGVDV